MATEVNNLNTTVLALKGLAEPTRLRMLALLSHGELTVGELCRVLGQSQPRVSRHLRLLTEAGFLDRFREKQSVYYRTPAVRASTVGDSPSASSRSAAAPGGAHLAWLRPLLDNVAPDDPAIRRDRVRLAVVMDDRTRLAVTALVEEHPLDYSAPVMESVELGEVLWEELGPTSLGALLDLGTGMGRMLELLAPGASHAVGIDISAPSLRLARTRVHGLGLAHCEFHCHDMYALPFEARRFDTLTIDRVLAGAERPEAVLAEAARVLRSGGRLLVVERFEDIEICTGVNPLRQMRQWLEGAGLRLMRLRPCDLMSGHHLIALAERPAAAQSIR